MFIQREDILNSLLFHKVLQQGISFNCFVYEMREEYNISGIRDAVGLLLRRSRLPGINRVNYLCNCC